MGELIVQLSDNRTVDGAMLIDPNYSFLLPKRHGKTTTQIEKGQPWPTSGKRESTQSQTKKDQNLICKSSLDGGLEKQVHH